DEEHERHRREERDPLLRHGVVHDDAAQRDRAQRVEVDAASAPTVWLPGCAALAAHSLIPIAATSSHARRRRARGLGLGCARCDPRTPTRTSPRDWTGPSWRG